MNLIDQLPDPVINQDALPEPLAKQTVLVSTASNAMWNSSSKVVKQFRLDRSDGQVLMLTMKANHIASNADQSATTGRIPSFRDRK